MTLTVDRTFTDAARTIVQRASRTDGATDLSQSAFGSAPDSHLTSRTPEREELTATTNTPAASAPPSGTTNTLDGSRAVSVAEVAEDDAATASVHTPAGVSASAEASVTPDAPATANSADAPATGSSAPESASASSEESATGSTNTPAAGGSTSATTPSEAGSGSTSGARTRRGALAGAIAEWGEQRRANASHRHQLKQDARDRRAARRRDPSNGTSDGWASRALAHVQRSLSEVAFFMAVIGSGLGQTMWWSTELHIPMALALSFSVTFEAIMLGADRRAMDRRMRHRSALALRLLSITFAAVAALMQFAHFSKSGTVAVLFGSEIQGSTELGAAFAAMTIGGFLVHTLSGNAKVNDRLVDDGSIRPLGAGRWTYPIRALKARRLLVDQPHLTVEDAWNRTRRPRQVRWSVRAAYRLGTRRAEKPEKPKQEQTTKPKKQTRKQRSATAAKSAEEQNAATPAETTENTPSGDQSTEQESTDTVPHLHPVSDPDSSSRPAPKKRRTRTRTKTDVGGQGKTARALAWLRGEITSGRYPNPREIQRETGLSNVHQQLKRWKQGGHLSEEEVNLLKAS